MHYLFFVFVVDVQMAQGNLALFCTHAAGMAGYFQHLVLILLVRTNLALMSTTDHQIGADAV